MSLMHSGRATGKQCPICGSPDGSCGGVHAGNESTPVDITPQAQTPEGTPDCVARHDNFGTMIEVLAHSAVAEERGWEIVRYLDGRPGPQHKARPAPEAVTPSSPIEEDSNAPGDTQTKPASRRLRTRAKKLGIEGVKGMSADELEAAVTSAEKHATEDPKK